MDKHALQIAFDARRETILSDWIRLLTFPSVSVDPAHAGDCRACAEWLRNRFVNLGFTAELLETARAHPVVFAERRGAPGAPTLLLYGHYDVQPADPLDQWLSPPFAPQWRGNRLYARGANDDKGQLSGVITAIQTLIQSNALRATIKIVIEGNEECSDTHVITMLAQHRERLRADILLVCDTNRSENGAPAITMGLRGLIHLTAVLRGPSHDLHSGVHGGRVPNPATGLAQMVASLHAPDGRIAVTGFYDGVQPPDDTERALANATANDPAAFERENGVPPVGGERAFTPNERTAFRPAIDVNGFHSGYGGAGSKTIIPSEATVKLSARLVPGQDPARMLEAIIKHLQAHIPDGLKMEITERVIGGPAIKLDLHSSLVKQACAALSAMGEATPVFIWEGASIPILSKLPALACAEPLLVGFGVDADRIHAPNESYSLDQFLENYLFAGLFIGALGGCSQDASV
ncbi:MAG: M20/M25/M40 family metallo-hydrolase [bacterium]